MLTAVSAARPSQRPEGGGPANRSRKGASTTAPPIAPHAVALAASDARAPRADSVPAIPQHSAATRPPSTATTSQRAVQPRSTGSATPVIAAASADSRKQTTAATSSGSISRLAAWGASMTSASTRSTGSA